MTNFTKTTLTNQGLALLAKEGVSVTITKVETGNGEYQENEKIGDMTQLKSQKQSFNITSALRKSKTAYSIKFAVSNKELTEDYLFTEIGVYANDPDEGEILYAVCYATDDNADLIRKNNGTFEYKSIIILNIEVNAGGTVKIVSEGLYALAEDVQELSERLDKHINSSTTTNTGLYKISVNATGHVNSTTKVTKEDITNLGIPGQDTKYTHPSYTAHGTGLYKVSVDASGHVNSVTAVTKSDITNLGIPGQDTNTTYGAASQSAAGLMSAADKKKLDNIAEGANKYAHPAYTARGTGLYKVSVDASGHVNSVTAVAKSDITNLGIPGQDTNTTYVVENNQVTTVAGHVADARQLNKAIEGTFAYLINSDLVKLNEALSHRALTSGKTGHSITLNVKDAEVTIAIVAVRVFTTVSDSNNALYFVTFVQNFRYPFILTLHEGSDITMTKDIVADDHFKLSFTSKYGVPMVTVLYLN